MNQSESDGAIKALGFGFFGRFKKVLGGLKDFSFDNLNLVSVADFVALFVGHVKDVDDLVGVSRDSGIGDVQTQPVYLLGKFIQQSGFVVGEHVDDCGGVHRFVVDFDPDLGTREF